ncbi:MAG: outer membrane lipoprotein carrier protein LolA [Deltaproteobacteria bacterium]|nr:outer membrane lipoprotein carrier protein LolA [Deltaproteobacteria bacterium]
MMNIVSRLLLVVISIAAGVGGFYATAVADDASRCVDGAIAVIQKRYESVSDLSASFVQTARSVALGGKAGRGQVSRGTVVFAKPGKMRWQYSEPEPSLVVSDGRTLWIHDPEHAEVQRMRVTEGYLSGAAIHFLIGEGDMRRDFTISGIACSEDTSELELIPKADVGYEKLRVVADRAIGELRRTTIYDLLGNVTEVVFSDVRANQHPDDSLFQFEAPPGHEVIDLDAR